MASAHFLVLVLAVTLIRGAEIFRYTDEVGGEHYMNGEPGVAVDGGWTFVSPEGEQIALTYEADELGFRPQGAHLPQAPREAEEVLQAKALFYTAYDEIAANLERLQKVPISPEAVEESAVVVEEVGEGDDGEEVPQDEDEDPVLDLRGGGDILFRRKRQVLVPFGAPYHYQYYQPALHVVRRQPVLYKPYVAKKPIWLLKKKKPDNVIPNIPEVDQSGVDAF